MLKKLSFSLLTIYGLTLYLPSLWASSSELKSRDSSKSIESYMKGRFYKAREFTHPNDIVIERILGPDHSEDFAIQGKMLAGVEAAIEVYRALPRVEFNLKGRNESSYTVLLVKKGQFLLDHIGRKEGEVLLNRFDAFVAKPGWSLSLEAIGDLVNELIVIHVTDPKMKGISQPPSSMKKAHAQFSKQKPVRENGLIGLVSYFGETSVQKIFELLGPKNLYLMVTKPVWGLEPSGALPGPDRFVLALARTPPSNGPALHIHRETDEVFMVLEGDFEVTYGDSGEFQKILQEGDVVAFPPSVNRTFRNIGRQVGVLMPLVFGSNNELNDIVFLPEVKQSLIAEGVSSRLLWLAEGVVGLQFKDRASIAFPFGDLTLGKN